jgi:hypothetical protein
MMTTTMPKYELGLTDAAAVVMECKLTQSPAMTVNHRSKLHEDWWEYTIHKINRHTGGSQSSQTMADVYVTEIPGQDNFSDYKITFDLRGSAEMPTVTSLTTDVATVEENCDNDGNEYNKVYTVRYVSNGTARISISSAIRTSVINLQMTDQSTEFSYTPTGIVSESLREALSGYFSDPHLLENKTLADLDMFSVWNGITITPGNKPGDSYHEPCDDFVRSPNLWAAALDLSCVSVWNSWGNGHLKAGTLVTPNHILFARHFYIPVGTKLKFLSADGLHVETRTVIAIDNVDDIGIGLLDSSVEYSAPVKVVPDCLWSYLTDADVPSIKCNHKKQAYPHCNYVGNANVNKYKWNTNRTIDALTLRRTSNDSGCPEFYVLSTELILSGVSAANQLQGRIADIQTAMDALWTANGGVNPPQLSFPDLTSFPTYMSGVTDRDIYVYISPTGLDTNKGTIDSPWLTVEHALATVGGGKTLILMPGVYRPSNANAEKVIRVEACYRGTAEHPTVLKSQYRWQAIIDAEYIDPVPPNTHTRVAHGIDTGDYAAHIVIDGFEVRNAWVEGIKPSGSYTIIRNCWSHHNGHGIGSHGYNYVLIENNLLEYNGRHFRCDHGIYADGKYLLVRGNIVRYNKAFGIHLWPRSYKSLICGNLVYGHTIKAGIVLGSGDTDSYNRVCHNAMLNNHPGNNADKSEANGNGEVCLYPTDDGIEKWGHDPILAEDRIDNVYIKMKDDASERDIRNDADSRWLDVSAMDDISSCNIADYAAINTDPELSTWAMNILAQYNSESA